MIRRKSRWYPVMHHPMALAQFDPMLRKMDQRDLWHTTRIHPLRQKGTTVHLDKEMLAVVFAVKKFHQFLYGRHLKIYTDHKPFLGLLHPERATPLMASSRMQRWALNLLPCEYEVLY